MSIESKINIYIYMLVDIDSPVNDCLYFYTSTIDEKNFIF